MKNPGKAGTVGRVSGSSVGSRPKLYPRAVFLLNRLRIEVNLGGGTVNMPSGFGAMEPFILWPGRASQRD
jgi:hypothetical protein